MTRILLDFVCLLIMLAWLALLAGFVMLAVTLTANVVRALSRAAHNTGIGRGGRSASGGRLRISDTQWLRAIGIRR
jgi:hypothetical protein